jgi:hypothetical protein
MIRVRTDQNFTDKRFIEDCNRGGLSEVEKFPWNMRGWADELVLREFMAEDRVVLTNDAGFAADHPYSIPDLNPGIIIVRYSDDNPRTCTMMGLRRIIQAFKTDFPQWSTASYNNSVLQITEKEVFVSHVSACAMVIDDYIEFSKSGWQTILESRLKTNAARGALS